MLITGSLLSFRFQGNHLSQEEQWLVYVLTFLHSHLIALPCKIRSRTTVFPSQRPFIRYKATAWISINAAIISRGVMIRYLLTPCKIHKVLHIYLNNFITLPGLTLWSHLYLLSHLSHELLYRLTQHVTEIGCDFLSFSDSSGFQRSVCYILLVLIVSNILRNSLLRTPSNRAL